MPEGPAGPGCGTRGRRRGLAGQRADAPSEARCADGSRAGRRPRAHQAARPHAAPATPVGPQATPRSADRSRAGRRPRAHQAARPHWCGGRRRDRRVRAGFEATRRAKLAARTARGRAATHGHTEQPGPHKQTTRHPEIRRGDKHRHQHPTTEAATGFPATASARSISATQRHSAKRHRRASATDQAVMST